jgi:predicted TIM-barrel fold metal-dependent hydrolase
MSDTPSTSSAVSSDGPVWDFHARLIPGPEAVERQLAAMDTAGVTRCVVVAGGVIDLDRMAQQIIVGGHVDVEPGNDEVRQLCEGTGGRLLPCWFGNPHHGPEEYRAEAAGYAGLELAPAVHGVPLNDPRTTSWIEAAAEAGHSVYVVPIGRPGCGTADFAALAERFPEVVFVLGHCGFIGIDAHAVNTVAPLKNVYAETSGAYTVIARIAAERLGADRVLFGSDHPAQAYEVELAKLRALRLPPRELRQVMWANASRILGEEGT